MGNAVNLGPVPGPYEVHVYDKGPECQSVEIVSRRSGEAYGPVRIARMGLDDMPLPVAVATAQLFKAAPDMRAALLVAKEALESCYNIVEWPANGQTKQDVAISTIDAALAKAGAQ